MNVHDKIRSPCPACGKKYSDLRQHIRVVHEGAKVTFRVSRAQSDFKVMFKKFYVYFPGRVSPLQGQIHKPVTAY